MRKANNFISVITIFFVIISCRNQQSLISNPSYTPIHKGLYIDTEHGSSIGFYIDEEYCVYIDSYSMPGDTIYTPMYYEQINNNIIELKGIGFEGYGINVSEIYSQHFSDSIEVSISTPNLINTKAEIELQFEVIKNPDVYIKKLYSYSTVYNSEDSAKCTFKIPRDVSGSKILTEAKITPYHYPTSSPGNELYYGFLSYRADPYWDLIDRSSPVFEMSDSLSRINVSLELSNKDIATPYFTCRLIQLNIHGNDQASMDFDGLILNRVLIDDSNKRVYDPIIANAIKVIAGI